MRIELCGVSKAFVSDGRKTQAVEGISWQAQGGEVLGLLGPNGAGKTTMIRLLLDLLQPDQGSIIVDGIEGANGSRNFKRRIGYVPEEKGMYRQDTAASILVYLASLKGVERHEAERRACALLRRFSLDDRDARRVGDFSKGMAQKVQIAAALIHEPEMILLDEPFSGLDPVGMREVREIIAELKLGGRLVLLSSHMMGEVEALCDRVFMIHKGRQVLCGKLEDIRRKHSGRDLVLDGRADTEGLGCVESVRVRGQDKYLRLKDGCSIHDLLAELAGARRAVERVEVAGESLEEIFVRLIGGGAKES